MGEREKDERLKEIWDKGGRTYSISKLNTINQCPYQAYLCYVKKEKGANNVWAVLGGKIHDSIEECVKNGADESIIKAAIQDELENLDILGLDFPLDRNGEPTIRNNWVKNMMMFSENFKTPAGKFETEQLILFPFKENIWMVGYVDAIRYNSDGSLWIIDWKSSSQFTKEHLLEAGRQLIVYAMAKELEGYEVKKVSWCMMKYCVTSWKLKNGKMKEKISEWRNLIKDLKSPLEKALKDLKYDDVDIECYMNEALQTNSFDGFPQEVKNKFKTRIYVRDYEITQELRDECLEYLDKSIELYETLGENEKNWKPCNIEKDLFFCSSLCGYSKKCKYYQEYCEKLLLEKKSEMTEDEMLFG